MNKRRVVYLFGAGAAISWGGPKTCEVTERIKNAGFYCKDNTTRITQRVFDELSKNSVDEKSINFETVLSTIEELAQIYSNNPFSNSLIEPKFTEELFNFGLKKRGNSYSLLIPKFQKIYKDKIANKDEHPISFFFKLLLTELHTQIASYIGNYSYHTKSEKDIILSSENADINQQFYKWIQQEKEDSILRLYTLNYDELFKVLLCEKGLNIFDGYSEECLLDPSDEIPPSIKKISTQFNIDTHYNLHGSIFWRPISGDEFGFTGTYFKKTPVPEFTSNLTNLSYQQFEKGKDLIISNIITGYQKAQRLVASPFRQMLSAFDRDTINADKIFIVGYGFGDEHINESIKVALDQNKSLIVIIIDPAFKSNKPSDVLPSNYSPFLVQDRIECEPFSFGHYLKP